MAEFLKRFSTRVSTRMAAVSRSALLLILIVTLGSFLRLFDLAEKSLWLDEIKSLEHAQSIHDLKSFFNPKTGNAHPPLYFLLLRGWLSFGDGEFHFRLLSALFGVLCIPRTYFLGKQFFDTRTSLWAAFMVAVSPFLLLHDREVRMYPMLVFFLLLSISYYVKSLRANRVRDWIGLTISMSVSVYTHYHAFLIFAAMWLFFIVRIKPYRSRLAPWLASSAVVTALFGFWLPGFLYHLERQAIYTPPDLFPSSFGQWLLPIYIFFSYSLGQTVMPWNLWVVAPGAIWFGGLCFWGLKSSAASKEALLFFLLFLFFPILLALWKSSAMPRYLLFLAPSFYLLVSKGLWSVPSRSARWIAAVLLPTVLITPLVNYYTNREFHILSHTDPLREVGTYLREHVRDGDMILNFGGGVGRLVAYYWRGDANQFIEDLIGTELTIEPAGTLETRLSKAASRMTSRIWVIVAFPVLKPFSDAGIQWMNQHYRFISEEKFGKDPDFLAKTRFLNKHFYEYRIRLYLYQPQNGDLSAVS